jgi:hypothetical protein
LSAFRCEPVSRRLRKSQYPGSQGLLQAWPPQDVGKITYIQDFAEAVRTLGTIEEIVGAMRSKYPDHGNVTTFLFSAKAEVRATSSQ